MSLKFFGVKSGLIRANNLRHPPAADFRKLCPHLMKKIECIIRSDRLKDLTVALRKAGVGGMTVSEVRGFGVQSERPDSFLFVHKNKIEIYATDSQVNKIISAILMYCSAGNMGDGKIAVMPLDDCIRISTGERKNRAIERRGGR